VAAMRDPISWSFPLGRMFGVTVRIHILFVIFFLGSVLRVAFAPEDLTHGTQQYEGAWIDILVVLILLFLSVLAHEFGHVFGARAVGGDCQEILMWPLGGLAYVDVPHTPRANFISTAAGPAVNLFICVLCTLLLLVVYTTPLQPYTGWLNGAAYNGRINNAGEVWIYTWNDAKLAFNWYSPANILSWTFRLNYILFLLNIVLVGFPMDSGRMLQCILWPRVGYRQATLAAVFAGFVCCVVLGVFSMWQNEMIALALCLFIFISCKNQWMILETGGDEALLGQYDFSQGYTSLERDEPPAPRVRRQSWWQRWLRQRAAKKMQRETENREADEQRMDQLLDKIQREGKGALTDEERRFLKRVSERYRNRN
jgi:stage IV sporulation protein FB